MKFAFVDRLGAHGIWAVIDPIAQTLLSSGHDVAYYRVDAGRNGRFRPAPTGVKVIPVKIAGGPVVGVKDIVVTLKLFFIFLRLFQHLKPDVVHTHFAMPSIPARLAARASGVPWVVSTQHETATSMRFHLRWGLRLTDICVDTRVFVSRTVAETFGVTDLDEIGVVPSRRRRKECVIYNGVNVPVSVPKTIERKADGLDTAAAPTLLCVGRLVPVKGQETLLSAMPLILEQWPGATCVFLGEGRNRSKLERLARDLGIQSKVMFRGLLDPVQVQQAYRDAELLVVPSDGTQEGFGLVVAEAMVQGTPVALSDIPVFREICTDDKLAWFFTPGNPDSLAQAVKAALSSPEERMQRAQRARAHVSRNFSIEKMAGKYLEVYQSLGAGFSDARGETKDAAGSDRQERSIIRGSRLHG